jgi:glycerol-3-phosphate acyltransferase PlsY
MINLYVSLLVAYLLGSIPFAVLITRYRTGLDLRALGDGNLGAKNVYLSVGHREGLVVGVLDIGKGAAAVLFSQALDVSLAGQLGVGLAVVMGHNWSIFLHFDGGQGMAATVGVFLALIPVVTLISIGLIAVTLWMTRNWDVACAIGLAWIPLASWLIFARAELAWYAVGMLPLILVRKIIVTAVREAQRHRIKGA